MKSERMVLRRFIRADIERLFVFHDDPEVMRFLNGGKPTPGSNEAWRNFYGRR